jgi:arginine deiminase
VDALVQEPVSAPIEGPRVHSEVGRLRSVLLHRPGAELRAIDAADAGKTLFSDPVDVEQAQAEHDAFAATLRERGVEVLYLEELLASVADDPRTGKRLLELALPRLPETEHRRLAGLDPRRLARALIEGSGRADVLGPLPNLLFVRDPSAWIGTGVAIGAMATMVRRREAWLMAALYALHPRFASSPVWTDGAAAPRFEGGDVLVAGDGRVVVGISPRTTARGAHRLAAALLRRRAAREVLTVTLPRGSGLHLDLVIAMIDHGTIAAWAPARHLLRSHRWRATSCGVAVCAVEDTFAWLSECSRIVEIDADEREHHGRRWDHGVNVLAVAPGVVVAFDDNARANERLASAGIEVQALEASALARGRGGPRGLSCPVARDGAGDAPAT